MEKRALAAGITERKYRHFWHGNQGDPKGRSVFTPQDPVTAQWISDALGPKTEVHQQTTYTGHRLAPWLGHVMVADQESSRPLLDAAEICKLPADEMIALVAGYPPIKAKRLKYYQQQEFADRAKLPPIVLPVKGPYPYRPRQHPNPWAGRVSPVAAEQEGSVAAPTKPNKSQPPGSGTTGGVAIPFAGHEPPPPIAPEPGRTERPDPADAIQEQLDLLTSEEEQKRRQGLDELERLHRTQGHGRERRIPI